MAMDWDLATGVRVTDVDLETDLPPKESHRS